MTTVKRSVATSEKDAKIFCIHSKSRLLQARFYDALDDSLQGLGITLVHYDDWSWQSSGGKSNEALEQEERRRANLYREGYSNLEGIGWIKNAPVDLELILRKREYPDPKDLNETDLARLLAESKCVILLEDENQTQLSEGVQIELGLLQSLDKRVLNIRLYHRREDAYSQSIYPTSGSMSPSSGVVGIGVSATGDIRPEDIELVTFITAIWCAEKDGGQTATLESRASKVDPYSDCSVGLEVSDLYLYKSAIRLAISKEDHIRRTAFSYIAAVRTAVLRQSFCCWLANLFRYDGPWQQYVDDFVQFTEFLPDIDRKALTDATRRVLRPRSELLVKDANLVSGIARFYHTPLVGLAKGHQEFVVDAELRERLRSIPRWAVVAFAAHVARNSWNLYGWQMSQRQAEDLGQTILLAQLAASAGQLEETEILSQSSVEMCCKQLGALAAIAAAAAAYASSACLYETQGCQRRALELDGHCRDAVASLILNVFSEQGVKRMIEELRIVADISTRFGWNNLTPISAAVFTNTGPTQSTDN